jgi:uncharacterized membrane protein
MSTLVVVGYHESHKAEELRAKLQTLQNQHLLDLAEVVVATSDEHGKIKLHHAGDLTNEGAVYGSLCASLANLVLMNATAGHVSGALAEVGLDDHFMKGLTATLTPGGSAIFVLTRTPSPDREQLLNELHGLGGKVLMTTLSHADEAKLQAALSGAKS